MQVLHKKHKNKNITMYIIVVIVIFFVNPFNVIGFLRNIVMIPISPLVHEGTVVGNYISNKIDMISSISSLYIQNQKLENEVLQLNAKVARLDDIKNENDVLRKDLDLLPRDAFKLVGGDVILRDSLGGNQWLVINRGRKDGVSIGKAVIVNSGILVGIVDEVNDDTSRVKLITHPDSVINIVTSRTGAEAIAIGSHGLSILMEDIKMEDDVQDGDMVVTSDIGNTFPRGLLVGSVQNKVTSTDKLFQNAVILPSAQLKKLQYVFVIK